MWWRKNKPRISNEQVLEIAQAHYASLGWTTGNDLSWQVDKYDGEPVFEVRWGRTMRPDLYIRQSDGAILHSELKPRIEFDFPQSIPSEDVAPPVTASVPNPLRKS